MEAINLIFGVPLGYILFGCYQLIGNFGLAILLFTLATKVILFPISLLAQKNAITMVRIQPLLEDIKRRFEGNNTLIFDEQKKLNKHEHYSMIKGMLPMLVQIPIILGLINVIYNPLQHLLHLDPQTIALLIDEAARITGSTVADMGYAAQLKVMELVQADPSAFSQVAGTGAAISSIQAIDLNFFGVNLAQNPSLTSLSVIYPILSGLSALVLCLYQNEYYVLQKIASNLSKWGMTIFLVLFSAYFAAVLPCGLGLYWTAGNLLSIVVIWLTNVIYNPKKLVDYDKVMAAKKTLSREERVALRAENKQKKLKERADLKRFNEATDRHLVIYSESNGFYKYFQGLIEWLLANSDVTIHYVTSDFNDKIFENKNPQIQAYYVGGSALISFMMKLDADMIIMSMPDLQKYHIKRSIIRKDMEYVYMDHGFGSFHMCFREGALDYFDTIFAYGPNHIEEVRQTEAEYGLPKKTIVKTGFGLFDVLLKSYAEVEQTLQDNDPKVVLIAPSWQTENIMETCLDELVQPLMAAGFKVVVRPHPEFVKRFGDKMDAIVEQYKDTDPSKLVLELDFSSNKTVYSADIVITDWSSISQEFSFVTKKPSIFINTPMKVMNWNYERIAAVPLEISLRDKLGVSLDMDELERTGEVALELVEHRKEYEESITKLLNESVFNLGDSAEAAGEYVLATLAEYERVKKLTSKPIYKSDALEDLKVNGFGTGKVSSHA